MILRKGNVVCQSDEDLDLREIVKEYLEISKMSRRYLNQYVNAAQEVLNSKEDMEVKRQTVFLYIFSIGRWFDTMTLKKRLATANETREAAEKCENHLRKKIEGYTDIANSDKDKARADIFMTVFVNYTNMHMEMFEKQMNLAQQLMTKIKKLEKITDKDRALIEENKINIIKNEKRLKMLYEQIDEVWTSLPEELVKEIVENEEMKKLKIDTSEIENKDKE